VARIRLLANAVGRIAAREARKSRVVQAGYAAAETTLRSLGRILHLIFLQIVGLFFCLFAVGLVARIPRAYHDQLTQNQGPGRTYLLAILSAMFLWFGLTSFWRSRRK